jgi:hypothetical protein
MFQIFPPSRPKSHRHTVTNCQLVTVWILTATEAEASKTSDGQKMAKENIQQATSSGLFTADDLKLGTVIGKCKSKRSNSQ